MFIRYRELLEELKKGKIYSFYLFSGEENYLKEEILKKIENFLLHPETKEFNYDLFYASETEPKTVINSLSTLPLLSSKRLVIVKNIEDWTAEQENEMVNHLNQLFPSPAGRPSTSCLILLTNLKVNYSQPLTSKINEIGIIVNFYSLSEKEIFNWVRKKIAEYNKNVSSRAIELFIELNGTDLFILASEIEKICLFVGEKKDIDESTILKITTQGRVYQINEFVNSLFISSADEILRILENLFTENEEPLKILGAVIRRLRLLLSALTFYKCGYERKKISAQFKISKFLEERFFQQLNNLEEEKLIKFLDYCLQADWEIKTGKKTTFLALENLVLNLSQTLPKSKFEYRSY